MLRDRTFRTLLPTIIIILLIAGLRWISLPDLVDDYVPDSFWSQKINAPESYDVVLLGDSRIYYGVSPQAMNTVLEDYDILNFGFSGGGLNPEMYDAAEHKLADDGERIIVLGISPHSLTANSQTNDHYHTIHADTGNSTQLYLPFEVDIAFQPFTIEDIVATVTNNPPSPLLYRSPHADGWIASYNAPPNIQGGVIAYQRNLTDNDIVPQLIDDLITQVGQWQQAGICVYVFRPPIAPEVLEVEQVMTSFDEIDIRDRLQNNGAIWLDFDASNYETYDGSHLHVDSARQFSVDIAEAIQNVPCNRE